MDLIKEWELENLERDECISIINKFLDWDILPIKYFDTIKWVIIYDSLEYKETWYLKLLNKLSVKNNPTHVDFSLWINVWRCLAREARGEFLKELIMQDLNSEKVSEELKNIFWEWYSPMMDDLILNHLNDDWEFTF